MPERRDAQEPDIVGLFRGEKGQQGKTGEHGAGKKFKLGIIVWAAALTLVFSLGQIQQRNHTQDLKNVVLEQQRQTEKLKEQNRRIQASRAASCRQTYTGIRRAFKPLIPKRGTTSPKQQAQIDLFSRTIDNLRKGCTRQTRPRPVPPPKP